MKKTTHSFTVVQESRNVQFKLDIMHLPVNLLTDVKNVVELAVRLETAQSMSSA